MGRKNRKHEFWTYLTFVEDICDVHVNERCSRLGMEKIAWKWEHIQKCVDDSFDNKGYEADNKILSKMRNNWSK